MPKTKMITRTIQFHPEIWKVLQSIAEDRDESVAGVVRDCVEDFIADFIRANLYKSYKDYIDDIISAESLSPVKKEELEEMKKALPKAYYKMSAAELAKNFNDCREAAGEV
jgi:hypothetical protein